MTCAVCWSTYAGFMSGQMVVVLLFYIIFFFAAGQKCIQEITKLSVSYHSDGRASVNKGGERGEKDKRLAP